MHPSQQNFARKICWHPIMHMRCIITIKYVAECLKVISVTWICALLVLLFNKVKHIICMLRQLNLINIIFYNIHIFSYIYQYIFARALLFRENIPEKRQKSENIDDFVDLKS
jgi:hypothetical protein